MTPYFITATVYEPNLFSLARLPSRRHFSSTVVSACTYIKCRVNSRASAWWYVLTSASKVVRHFAFLVEGQFGRTLRTGSHTLLCRGVGYWRWGVYGGCTLLDYTASWGLISTVPRGIGRARANSTKHAQVPILRLEYPCPITPTSWR